MSEKIRLAIFQKDLSAGGIQRSLVNLLNNIDNRKYEVDLYLWSDKDFCKIINKKINIIRFKKQSKIGYLLRGSVPFWIQKIFYRSRINQQYDIAIDFDSYSSVCGLASLKVRAKKRLIWVHNDVTQNLKTEFKYRILWHVIKPKYKMFDQVVAVSEGAKASILRQTNLKNVVVVPNYIAVYDIIRLSKEKYTLSAGGATKLVSMTRLTYQKGCDVLIDEFAKAININPNLKLYIIGDGQQRKRIESQISRLGLTDKIVLLGEQKNPYKIMARADAFVITSRFEGQGMAILEAKVLGLPIIMPKHLMRTVEDVEPVNDVARAMADLKPTIHKIDKLIAYNRNAIDEFYGVCTAKPKVIFTASGGGHYVELMYLKSLIDEYDSLIVTEATGGTEHGNLLRDTNKNFIAKVIINFRNLWRSVKIVRQFRPNFVISTGASSATLVCYAAKYFTKSKIIYIETAANISTRSFAGKLSHRIVDLFIVQYKQLQKLYSGSKYGGLIFNIKPKRIYTDDEYIFVQLGTQQNQFSRLLDELEKLNLPDKIIVQSGHTNFKSRKMSIQPFVDAKQYQKLLAGAKIVITHAGVASIVQSLALNKPTIVVPRMAKFHEHLNDHQSQIADYFAKTGHIIKVDDISNLGPSIERARSFKPPSIKFDNAKMKELITEFIDDN